MYTYRDLIRIYSKNVADGISDIDLGTGRTRKLTSVMLNLASNSGWADTAYPPSADARDGTIKHLGDILWDARPLVEATSPSVSEPFQTAIDRTIECLRNI